MVLGSRRENNFRQEEIMQAVVIADSFNVRFAPVTDKTPRQTHETPRALLPLVNVPMLDYTLHFLQQAGIQETFVFCCRHADQIREHLKKKIFSTKRNKMVVRSIYVDGCLSFGDAMREIDSRSLIRGDFFLLNSDTVANVDLMCLIKDHRERRIQVKTALMTVNCIKIGSEARMRCVEDNVTFATVKHASKICFYEKESKTGNLSHLTVQSSMLVAQPVDIWDDLLDCQLFICSPTVLTLFTDNFDYKTISEFIKGVLINEEILGYTIHLNILQNEYCVRVTNPYMYSIVSKDIIRRRVFPLHPGAYISGVGDSMVESVHHYNYVSKYASVASSVHLISGVVVGSGTEIIGGTIISQSVIGSDCHIGSGVRISECYVWDRVTIGDGCTVDGAIICSDVIILPHTTVQPCSILSWGVKVGSDVVLPPNLRLQAETQEGSFLSAPTSDCCEEDLSYARLYVDGDDERQDHFHGDWGERLLDWTQQHKLKVVGCREASVVLHDEGTLPLKNNEIGDEDLDEHEEDEEEDSFDQFYSELIDTIKRRRLETICDENLIIEVNSLKHAYNISINNVHQALMRAIVDIPVCECATVTTKELLTSVLTHIASHMGLLKNYIKQKEAQMDCLSALEDFAVENEKVLGLLNGLIHYLYHKDVLDEDVILRWFNIQLGDLEHEDDLRNHEQVREKVKDFAKWLEEAEEESDVSLDK